MTVYILHDLKSEIMASDPVRGVPRTVLISADGEIRATRFVTDWAGPDAFLKRVNIRLGAPNYPGDTMIITGKVSAKDDEAETVDVELVGANGTGHHVTGTVRVRLPRDTAGVER